MSFQNLLRQFRQSLVSNRCIVDAFRDFQRLFFHAALRQKPDSLKGGLVSRVEIMKLIERPFYNFDLARFGGVRSNRV